MRRVMTRENLCFDAALDESGGHLLDDGFNAPTVRNEPFCDVQNPHIKQPKPDVINLLQELFVLRAAKCTRSITVN